METGKPLYLSDQERARVEQAVQAAERSTSAEIVPMIVEQSGLYRDAGHRAGLVMALLTLAGLLTIETGWLPWGWHAANAGWLLLATIVAYGTGTWLGSFAPLVRLFTSAERMHHKVRLRAEKAFLSHGLSRTRERTGVLIMLSLLEHQVYVLPDQALRGRIPSERWDGVVAAIVNRVRAGDVAGGLCDGIERCGQLLAECYPARAGDNPNELPDTIIQGE